MGRIITALLLFLLSLHGASRPTQPQSFDLIIKNGTVFDGTGGTPRRADVGIKGDKIVRIGNLSRESASVQIDASGMAVAPGFINMLSWAVDDLIIDGRSMGDIKQGVTTEIFGEGASMGPLNEVMKKRRLIAQGDLKFPIESRQVHLTHAQRRQPPDRGRRGIDHCRAPSQYPR